MKLSINARQGIVEKYSSGSTGAIDPALLDQIIDDVIVATGEASAGNIRSPFAAPWLDSFLAHWVVGEDVDVMPASGATSEEALTALRELVDLKFRERLEDLQRFIRDQQPLRQAEPGEPPVGPRSGFLGAEPPDGGPPEPGTPPVGPRSGFLGAEPPDGGPPEPGTPPVGPQAGFLADNPWILYWFISLRAPMLLDMIDAHLTRRLEELRAETA